MRAHRLSGRKRAGAAAAWKEAVAAGAIYETEYRLRRADGVYRLTLARGVPMAVGDGVEYVGMSIDITEQRQAEERFRALADNLAQLAWMAQTVAPAVHGVEVDRPLVDHEDVAGWAVGRRIL